MDTIGKTTVRLVLEGEFDFDGRPLSPVLRDWGDAMLTAAQVGGVVAAFGAEVNALMESSAAYWADTKNHNELSAAKAAYKGRWLGGEGVFASRFVFGGGHRTRNGSLLVHAFNIDCEGQPSFFGVVDVEGGEDGGVVAGEMAELFGCAFDALVSELIKWADVIEDSIGDDDAWLFLDRFATRASSVGNENWVVGIRLMRVAPDEPTVDAAEKNTGEDQP